MKETLQNFYKDAFAKFDKNFTEQQKFLIENPQKKISFEIPLVKSNGELDVYKGFRVQHNNLNGPFKGGMRFSPDVTMEHCEVLASLMTLKTSLTDLPFGGGKGGVTCNTKKLSNKELSEVVDKLVNAMHTSIGSKIDIPAPDMGTNAEIMKMIFQSYSQIYGYSPGVVTGKPTYMSGLRGRNEATGKGAALIAKWAYEKHFEKIENSKVSIQGFGNVGKFTAKFLSNMGAKIVAVSNSSICLYNEKGIEIEKLLEDLAKIENSSLSRFDNLSKYGEQEKSEKIFEVTSDIFIPAATENTITEDTVKLLAADLIIEAANMPTTHLADKWLKSNNKIIIPDILASAGGVIGSYFEWSQNSQNEQWEKSEVYKKIEKKLSQAWINVTSKKDKKNTYRETCYIIAIEKLVKAMPLSYSESK